MPFTTSKITPPKADKRPIQIEQLGRIRTDDYAWLKDENWQDVMKDPSKLNPAIDEHLRAENAYSKAVMAETEDLQQDFSRDERSDQR